MPKLILANLQKQIKMSSIENISLRNAENTAIASITGWSFAIMFALGIFAEFFVRIQLINWNDATLTMSTIKASQRLFEAGIFAFILIIFLDVVITITFYILFNTISKPIAMVMASLRIVYVAIKGAAIVGLILANDIYTSVGDVAVEQIETYATQAMQFLKLHHSGFGVALIFFGIHLIFVAILLLKFRGIPKLITWLVLVAGTGYTVNSLVSFFAVDYILLRNITIGIFIIPMTFAELTLGLWLWIKRKRLPLFLSK